MSATVIDPGARRRELRTRWWFPDHLVISPLLRDLRDMIRYARGQFLDLGCGNAPYKPWFEARVDKYVTADFPPVAEAVQVACDTQQLPFRDASFDTVLCTQVLEHV